MKPRAGASAAALRPEVSARDFRELRAERDALRSIEAQARAEIARLCGEIAGRDAEIWGLEQQLERRKEAAQGDAKQIADLRELANLARGERERADEKVQALRRAARGWWSIARTACRLRPADQAAEEDPF